MEPIKQGPTDEKNAPCVCMADDAVAARDAIRAMPQIDRLVAESHFSVSICRCPRCDQLFLVVFTELIDWDDGDDSQATLYAPITAEEAQQLRGLGENIDGLDIAGLCGARPHIHDIMPRGCKDFDEDKPWMAGNSKPGPKSLAWRIGEVVVLPHD